MSAELKVLLVCYEKQNVCIKVKELEFQLTMIRFVGDACHTFTGIHMTGGIVFNEHIYLVKN